MQGGVWRLGRCFQPRNFILQHQLLSLEGGNAGLVLMRMGKLVSELFIEHRMLALQFSQMGYQRHYETSVPDVGEWSVAYFGGFASDKMTLHLTFIGLWINA